MLRASALYMVIVIALVIGIVCSSLITVAYLYRMQYQKVVRGTSLQQNLKSAVTLLMADEENAFSEKKTISLFGTSNDSVSVQAIPWGVFDIGIAEAFAQKDTLYKVFSMAHEIDSAKWAALYLIDEDRPVSVSGKTQIRGNAFIPKAGVKQAYVDNKAYEGDSRLIAGKTFDSARELPKLRQSRLDQLEAQWSAAENAGQRLPLSDSLNRSFLVPPLLIALGKKTLTLSNVKLTGNIIILSDTALTIDSTARIEQVLVFAKSIRVRDGFRGSCQLFARDSVNVGSNCALAYPSCVGVIRTVPPGIASLPEQISIGDHSTIWGLIFTSDARPAPQKLPIIALGRQVAVNGQIYTQGRLSLRDGGRIAGSVFTGRFHYQSGFTQYENYIINTSISSTALSAYYLTSDVVPVSGQRKKVLQWLEAN